MYFCMVILILATSILLHASPLPSPQYNNSNPDLCAWQTSINNVIRGFTLAGQPQVKKLTNTVLASVPVAVQPLMRQVIANNSAAYNTLSSSIPVEDLTYLNQLASYGDFSFTGDLCSFQNLNVAFVKSLRSQSNQAMAQSLFVQLYQKLYSIYGVTTAIAVNKNPALMQFIQQTESLASLQAYAKVMVYSQ